MHGKKNIVLETGHKRVMGAKEVSKIILPKYIDPIVKHIKEAGELDKTAHQPWMPEILPLQIITIGSLAIVALPAEPTTISGQRMKKTVLRILKHKGIKEVIIAGYCNGYSGYITTPSEYDCQFYEGGHTIFGKWTLPAYQTKLKKLATEMLKKPKQRNLDRNTKPLVFDKKDIWFYEPKDKKFKEKFPLFFPNKNKNKPTN